MGSCGSKDTTGEMEVIESDSAPATTKAKPANGESGVETQRDIKSFFKFGPEIGRGGFSIVYKGTPLDGGKNVAIKAIRKEMVEGDDIKLLRREIGIMKKVDHPSILKLYQVFESDEDFYLVMELVEGKELFDKIVDKGQYSEKDASNIVKQIISAVEYLHSNGIAHRDLKPENLLSAGDDESEMIKIADFGFAKTFSGEEKLITSCGSPGYVAPEVLTSDSYTPAVDMWSIGVIVYILLCGYPPFYADNAPALFKKIMEVQFDFIDPAWEEVSEDAKDLISKLLVKDPKERLTATQCKEHPWVVGEHVTDKKQISMNIDKIRAWKKDGRYEGKEDEAMEESESDD